MANGSVGGLVYALGALAVFEGMNAFGILFGIDFCVDIVKNGFTGGFDILFPPPIICGGILPTALIPVPIIGARRSIGEGRDEIIILLLILLLLLGSVDVKLLIGATNLDGLKVEVVLPLELVT